MDLVREIPPVKRCRGYRIYTTREKRLLDLYLDNGRFITGHRPDGAGAHFKGSLSKGLSSAYPGVHESRALRALKQILPDRTSFSFFRATPEDLSRYCALTGGKEAADPLLFDSSSTLLEKPAAGGAVVWRPFSPIDYSSYPVLLLVLPTPLPVLVAALQDRVSLPSGSLLSGIEYDSISRAVRNLQHLSVTYDEKQWDSFQTALGPAFSQFFDRKGPYLLPKWGIEAHERVFRHFIEKGVLISPKYPGVSIVPGEFESGELTALKKGDRSAY